MYYENGLAAINGLLRTLEAEGNFARKSAFNHIKLGNELSLADAHSLVLESMMELHKVLDDIRNSAKRNVNPF